MTEVKQKIKESVIIALIISLIFTMTPITPSVFAEDDTENFIVFS